MQRMGLRLRFANAWRSMTIKKKIRCFTMVVLLIICVSILFALWVVKYSLKDFNHILEDNSRSSKFVERMEQETILFKAYIKNPTEDKQKELFEAFESTKTSVAQLPSNYETIGAYRYSKTWSIQNSYETYEKARDYFLSEKVNSTYISQLYELYKMQDTLQGYARTLMSYTMQDGSDQYQAKVPGIRLVPVVVIVFGGILLCSMIHLATLMKRTIISPVMKLVDASKKLASNDYDTKDVQVENKDELGELVRAFNMMKYSTIEYINALEEKRKTLNLLHKEELEKLEVEKRLEMTKLELLKNQVNPHFLFNTLNVIGGMANLEEASTTERMIKALSSLFRYILKTKEEEVSLAEELRVVRDYMYLQGLRFGSRIQYSIECKVDEEVAQVPSFTFQPLVENAIVHGIAGKEEGGKILIRIRKESNNLVITIADTGNGMTKEQLETLRAQLLYNNSERIGIGLGNIYQRIYGMYQDGKVEIYSRHGVGTVVCLIIPQRQ